MKNRQHYFSYLCGNCFIPLATEYNQNILMESKRKTDDITFHIYAVHFFFSRLDYIMNYYEYIVLDAMDIFYVFYDILLLIKIFSGFVYLLFFLSLWRLKGKNTGSITFL